MASESTLFDVIITGYHGNKSTETLIREVLQLFPPHQHQVLELKLSDALLFGNHMAAIGESLSASNANALIQRLQALEISVEMRPALSLLPKEAEERRTGTPATYTCPACGHVQPKQQFSDNRLESCERCGIVGERYSKKQRFQQVLQQEKAFLEKDRARRIRATLEQAKLDEERLLQERARRQLGVTEPSAKLMKLAIAGVGVALCLGLGIIYYVAQPTPEELAAQEAAEQAERAAKQAEIAKKLGNFIANAQAMATQIGQTPSHPPLAAEPALAPSDASETSTANAASTAPPKANDAEIPEHQARLLAAFKLDQAQQTTNKDASKASDTAKPEPAAPVDLLTPLHHLAAKRQRIQQFLKLDEKDLAEAEINATQEAYTRSLLHLDMLQWYQQKQRPSLARNELARIQQVQTATEEQEQRALVTSVCSQAYAVLGELEEATAQFAQASELANTLPTATQRANTLLTLAEAQLYFGNNSAAKQLLAASQAQFAALTPPERTAITSRLVGAYIELKEFTAATQLAAQVEETSVRELLLHKIQQAQQQPLQTAQQRD